MRPIEGEVIRLSWEEIQTQREVEDWIEQANSHRDRVEDQFKAIGLLTYCVNEIDAITDAERGLLREMLMAAQSNTMALWGALNLHRMEIVRQLFEKLKDIIRAG